MSEEEQYLVWKSMTEVNIENGYNFKVISDDENNKISGGYDLTGNRAYFKSI